MALRIEIKTYAATISISKLEDRERTITHENTLSRIKY